MPVEKLPNGNLLVPRRAEGPGGIIGDGVEEIGPDHPAYEGWIAWIRRGEEIDEELRARRAKAKPAKGNAARPKKKRN